MDNKPNIALVTFPYSYAVPTGLKDFITKILTPLCNNLILITGRLLHVQGKNIRVLSMPCQLGEKESLLRRVAKVIIPQFGVTAHLLRLCRQCDIIIFFCTAELFLLPMLIGRLMGKRIIIMHTNNLSISYRQLYSQGIKQIALMGLRLIEKTAFSLAHRIVLQSQEAIPLLNLRKYCHKISLTHYYFISNQFKPEKDINKRPNQVGYIGKFAFFKGVVNFAKAMPLVLAREQDISFLMAGGSGIQLQQIETELRQNNSLPHVTLHRSVPPEKVAQLLNQLKLLVLPSHSEGVPKVVLEAMACGTPVLATPVGGITSIIEDGVNGFLLKDNSPGNIAEGIIQVLHHPNLSQISQNARKRIESDFARESIADNWQTVLYS